MTVTAVEAPKAAPAEHYFQFGPTARMGMLFTGLLLGTGNGLVGLPPTHHPESTSWFASSVGAGSLPVEFRTRLLQDFGPESTIPTNAQLLEHLRATSGLTWDQAAKLFNVSRRSLHLWMAGGKMSAANEERLNQLVQIVDGLAAETPEQRRRLLMQPTAEGRSVFDAFRGEAASGDSDINRNLEPLGDEPQQVEV